MTFTDDRDRDDRNDRDEAVRRQGRGWTGWQYAGVFVLGLVAGVLLLGLLGEDPPAPATAPAAAPSEPVGPSTATAQGGRVEVNAACLRAINAAQDIAAAVEDLGTAAAVLDAAQLDEAVRRIQPLQARLQDNTAACEATGSAEAGPTSSTSPPASPSD